MRGRAAININIRVCLGIYWPLTNLSILCPTDDGYGAHWLVQASNRGGDDGNSTCRDAHWRGLTISAKHTRTQPNGKTKANVISRTQSRLRGQLWLPSSSWWLGEWKPPSCGALDCVKRGEIGENCRALVSGSEKYPPLSGDVTDVKFEYFLFTFASGSAFLSRLWTIIRDERRV